MKKLQFHDNKVLKLTNVLKYKLPLNDENFNFNAAIQQMQTYIQTKGALPVGPLIQYTRTRIDSENKMDIEIIMMMQSNHYIDDVKEPYSMESVIRIPNALYCRYMGPKGTMRYAYDKINLEAFESDIQLSNCNYTIFVEENMEEESIVADVFVPREENI